jgi:alkanesulfonate monooxygenase SsuD/methylene tetrahydromethanopterin reductase-like flavin-dependent oxidoreductase (luciferase family)
MRCALGLPTTEVDAPEEFLTAPAIADTARHAEALGFDAVHVTDDRAGDQQWLDTGGHHALDPFVALSFASAAKTTRSSPPTSLPSDLHPCSLQHER